ncbi:5-formyltetrahydrofolate cyclo-ligase [Candidatus Micrarchaeota archaeon]|nr:5-formyltetrahydrofolate cyclo-ligase [Candidatus Micrarchaeota archaeon]
MVSKAKGELRKKLLSKRNSLTEKQHSSMGEAIKQKLFSCPRFQKAKTVAFYLHKGSEVNTKNMISEALLLGKEVIVPVTNDKITFYRFTSFEDLQEGKYGILEPKTKVQPSKSPDVIIIPGISFGLCMHRIGYGKGHYDNYLGKSFAYRIGICYDFQVIESLPRHENDQRMDEIITEKRIIS